MLADSRALPLKDNSVNCIITSPPYWSLRKYDIPDLIWDGAEGCEHRWGDQIIRKQSGGIGKNNVGNFSDDRIHYESKTQFCLLCNAWRGQLGLEPTIDLYLNHLLQIMDECKRVLRDDGTMWVNLGDSYYGGKGQSSMAWCMENEDRDTLQKSHTNIGGRGETRPLDLPQGTIQPKSLCLIPERFAIEMVNRGWILRNKLVWHKPNCMPSSAKDRFTVDFENVFFFVKSRKYWFEQQYDQYTAPLDRWGGDNLVAKGQSTWDEGTGQTAYRDRNMRPNPQGRNRRCVWTIPTQPYPESHFATFPEALVEPMIKAGCPKEICVKCGKAREKIEKVIGHQITDAMKIAGCNQKGEYSGTEQKDYTSANAQKPSETKKRILESMSQVKEYSYTDCGCNAGFRTGIVLDPFCGSGTVMKVAEQLNRKAIGLDLGYQTLSVKRLQNVQKELTL